MGDFPIKPLKVDLYEPEYAKTLFLGPPPKQKNPAKEKISRIPIDYPQGELYEVISVNTNATYNLAKSSAFHYTYSPSGLPGGTNFGGDLWLPEGMGTRLGPQLDSVISILPRKSLKCEPGDIVEVCFYDRNRQRPYIKRIFKKGKLTQVEDTLIDIISIGTWMQSEGNYRLSQSGKAPLGFPSDTNLVIPFNGLNDFQFGLDRLLGTVCHEGLLMLATYLANSALDGYDKIRMEGYSLGPTFEQVWSVDFTLPTALTNANVPFRYFRSNLFYNVDNKILTACGNKIWSLQLNAEGVPSGIVESNIDGRLACSVAGPNMLVPSSAGNWKILKINVNNLNWQTIVDNLAINTNLGNYLLRRPWPYSTNSSSWPVLENPETVTPSLTRVTRFGSVAQQPITLPSLTRINIDSLLSAADTAYSAFAEGSEPYPYFPNESLVTPESGDLVVFPNRVWVGRTGPSSDDGGGIVYVCPRFGGGVGNYYQWTETLEEATVVPALRQTSDNQLVYAAIEPVPILTSGIKIHPSLVDSTDYFDIPAFQVSHVNPGTPGPPTSSFFRVPPEETPNALDFIGETTNYVGGYYGTVPATGRQINLVDSHQTKLEHNSRTMLRKLTATGTTTWQLNLSSGPFVGNVRTNNTDMTEQLDYPENVFDIKLGPESAEFDYKDACFLIQNRRETRDAPASRPCFRFISSNGSLRSTVMLSPGSTVTPVVIDTEESFVAEEDNQFFFEMQDHVPEELLAIYINDVEQDISDTANIYFTGSTLRMNLLFSAGADIRVAYNYTENADLAGQYQLQVNGVALAVNIGTADTTKWALVGVYTDDITNGDFRTDLYVLNLTDPDNVTIETTLIETNSRTLPQQNDFDRFVFTESSIYFIGNKGSGYNLYQLV